VFNSQGGASNVAAPTLIRVTALARGSETNIGVRNIAADPELLDVSATGFGGMQASGIENRIGSSMTMIGGAAEGLTQVTDAWADGLLNTDGSVVTVSGSNLFAVGDHASALSNSGANSRVIARSATVSASGINTHGVWNVNSGVVQLLGSSIHGFTRAVYTGSQAETLIGASLVGAPGVQNELGGMTSCAGAFDQQFLSLSDTCQ